MSMNSRAIRVAQVAFVAGFAGLVFSCPAMAGFEWIPPKEVEASAPAPVIKAPAPVPAPGLQAPAPVLAAPSAPVPFPVPAVAVPNAAPQGPKIDLYPLENERIVRPLPPVPVAPAPTTGGDAYAPHPVVMPPVSAPVVPSQVVAKEPLPFYSEAIGFGRDLPLALAARQIIPADYTFSFSGSVNPGKKIDWDGGAPWNEVLSNTLEPHGIAVAISGQHVVIRPAGHGNSGWSEPPTMPAVSPVVSDRPADLVPFPVAADGAIRRVKPPMDVVAEEDAAPMLETPSDDLALGGEPDMPESLVQKEEKISDAWISDMPGVSTEPAETADLSGEDSDAPMPYVYDPTATRVWNADFGVSLREVLSDWSDQAGVQLYWASQYDFPLQSSVKLNGTYSDAVETLLNGLMEARPRPLGRLHPNLPEGPAVLVVETRHVIE